MWDLDMIHSLNKRAVTEAKAGKASVYPPIGFRITTSQPLKKKAMRARKHK